MNVVYSSDSQPMGRDPELDRLKILTVRLFFFLFFFIGLHLKIRDIKTFVIHKSDPTRGNLWVTDVKTFFFIGLHLTFRKLF